MGRHFDQTKWYSQKDIMDELGIKSYATFRKYYKNRRDFPNPVMDSKTHPKWDGLALQNYFFKKANRYV